MLPVATIEAAAGIVPTADQLHYVIKSLTSLSTYLQHRVNNQQAAVVTDMSTVCAFISPTTPTAPTPSTPSDRRE